MEKEEELFIPKTKHKGLKITIGIILIAGLITGAYFLYQYKFNNPKSIINKVLEDAEADIKEKMINEFNSDKYKIDGHIKVEANMSDELSSISDVLKDIEVQFNGEIDTKESTGVYTINTKYKNDKLINIKTYYEKEMSYVLFEGIYDKYLKTDTSKEQEKTIITDMPNLNINPNDIQVLTSSLLSSLKKAVNDLDFKQENTTITVDGKELDVINNYVMFKDKEVNDFIKKVVNELRKDTNFANTLKKFTDEDIESILEKVISGINEQSFEGTYKLCFYTDKGIFNKKLVRLSQTITMDSIPITFNIDKLSDDEKIISMSTIGVEYSIKVKKNSSVINILLTEKIMDMYMKVDLSMNYEKINEITKPDVSNSVDINDLKDDEIKEIENKFNENKVLNALINEMTKDEGKEA